MPVLHFERLKSAVQYAREYNRYAALLECGALLEFTYLQAHWESPLLMSSPYYESHDASWTLPQRETPQPGEPPQLDRKDFPPEAQPPRRVLLPVALFLATCYSTYSVSRQVNTAQGAAIYAIAVMTILTFHEFGHFLQARRYGVPASWPFFIPMPIGPIGTMGAVIGMSGGMGNRKALFDIGITGPLAGLVPTLICVVVGLQWSHVGPQIPGAEEFGEPLLFQFISRQVFGPLPPNTTVYAHPLCMAGWVGIFLTALNLFPISQLDGGHVLYALLRRKAHVISTMVLASAAAAVLLTGNYGWLLMIMLLTLIGPNHPPTANDSVPLGTFRVVLGWLTLAFVIIGFTPTPFYQVQPQRPPAVREPGDFVVQAACVSSDESAAASSRTLMISPLSLTSAN